MRIPAHPGLGLSPSMFPLGLPALLDRAGFRGHVYNSASLGGFYMLHGYPARRPLVETRWTAYDEPVLERILRAPASEEAWRRLVADYRIEGVLLDHLSVEARLLLPRLAADPSFRLAYLDAAASFWARGPFPAASAPLPPERLEDNIRLSVFYGMVGELPAQLALLERAAGFGWRRPKFLGQIAALQLRLGRNADAARTLRQLLDEEPDDPDGLRLARRLAGSAAGHHRDAAVPPQ
jgi:hypothetical protein